MKTFRKHHYISLLTLLLLLAIVPFLKAQDHPETVIAIRADSYRQALNSGLQLSFDGIMDDGRIRAYMNTDDLPSLDGMRAACERLPLPSLQHTPRMKDMIESTDTSWDFYPGYLAYETLMAQFVSTYPGICRLEVFGTLSSGRKLMALVISDNVDSTEAEPRFLYTSSMHGDELVGYILLLHLAEYLLENYGSVARVNQLVNNAEIWINPLANPDGTYHSGNNTVSGARRFNANNVDINRNFPDPEDGPHPDGNTWQQETQAFVALASAKKFNISANIHGGAEVCNYPWDTWAQLPADDTWWVNVCNAYADTAQFCSPAGYMNDFGTGVTNGYDWYTISGGRQDYMNYFHHCREFTLEISSTKLPSASQLPAFWNYNYRSLLNYIEQSLYGVSGTVTDSLTGLPLQARVYISGHDIDSSHVWSRLPHGDYYRYLYAGSYDLSFSAPGYTSRTYTGITVQNGNATILNAKLLSSSAGDANLCPAGFSTWFDTESRSLHVTARSSAQHPFSVSVYSTDGRELLRREMDQEYILPANLGHGLFIARIQANDGTECTLKFVIK